MVGFWTTVSEGQATLLASFLAILAAVVGVLLGGWVFGGRVNDLKSALGNSKEAIDRHSADVEQTLAKISRQMDEAFIQLSTTAEAIGQLRGSVGDLQVSSVGDDETPAQFDTRERIRADWTAIRDSIEKMVADPAIDGRTRAKYARKDRRQYGDLVESYHDDYGLQNVNQYRRAIQIWHKYKNGKVMPSPQDANEMSEIRNKLAP